MNEENHLIAWHIANVPNEPFTVKVDSIAAGKKLLEVLAAYDIYLGDLVDSNAQGISQFIDGEWEDVELDDETP